MIENFLSIAAVHFFGIISPGQDFIGISRYVLQKSLKPAIFFALGIAIGQSLIILLSITGVAEIVLRYSFVKIPFYLISGIYLIYLAFLLLKSGKIEIKNGEVSKQSPIKLGFFITITNPKAPIFYSVVLASLISKTAQISYLIALWAYLSIATFVLFALVAVVFDKFREKIVKYMFYIEKLFGICLFYLGFKLIFSVIIS